MNYESETETALVNAQGFLTAVRESLGDDVVMAREIAAEAKAQYKALDERRTYFKAPSLEACNRIDGAFMPPIKLLKEVEAIAKDVIHRAVARSREAQRAALAAAATSEALALAVVPTPLPEGIRMRKVARVRVTAYEDIPDEYWIFDEKLALADLKAGRAVPGCELYCEETVENRT